MDVEMAAYYVGLSSSAFKLRVETGEYPLPEKKGGRLIWDREKLDVAMNSSGRSLAADKAAMLEALS
jgi:hypothetical protein